MSSTDDSIPIALLATQGHSPPSVSPSEQPPKKRAYAGVVRGRQNVRENPPRPDRPTEAQRLDPNFANHGPLDDENTSTIVHQPRTLRSQAAASKPGTDLFVIADQPPAGFDQLFAEEHDKQALSSNDVSGDANTTSSRPGTTSSNQQRGSSLPSDFIPHQPGWVKFMDRLPTATTPTRALR